MGAWGTGSFENNDAIGWVDDLVHSDGYNAVTEVLAAVANLDLDEYLEAPDAARALAAAEVVAAIHGYPPDKLPDKVKKWVAENPKLASHEPVQLAVSAVERVRSHSELKELWEKGDSLQWNAEVENLVRRLLRSHRAGAKTLDEKLDNLDEFTGLVFGGEASVDDLAREYSRPELLDFLQRSIGQLREMVRVMTPEQIAYRIPGAPTGLDESGDETHFDTSEIVTHVCSGLTFHRWHIARALGHERPEGVKPPEGTTITGKKRNAMGGGGWSGMSAPELDGMLEEALANFLPYAQSLPEEYGPEATSRHVIFGHMTPAGWLFLACVHPAMHVRQIRNMQAQGDYPAGDQGSGIGGQ